MNWSSTKTIFIVCFFLLDVFLGYQLYERQQRYNLDSISMQSVEMLQKKDIKIVGNLPDPKQNITFLRGQSTSFINSQGGNLIAPIQALEKDANNNVIQTITPNDDGTIIKSTFKSPMAVPKNDASRVSFLDQFIYKGDNYQFWKQTNSTLIFVQTFEGKPVFSTVTNQPGVLKVFISKSGQVTGYQQSYLDLQKPDNKANNSLDIITPSAAIDNLWRANDIPATGHAKITHVELGYFNLIGSGTPGNNLLVFVPAWHVIIKSDAGTKDYFVNAIYGIIFPTEKTE